MATLMQTDAVRKRAGQPIDFKYVGEEFAQLEYFVCHGIQLGRMSEYLFVMVPHHRHATTGRRNDVIVKREYFEESLGERPRIAMQAGVGHRLAAAGLFFGIFDGETLSLQQ